MKIAVDGTAASGKGTLAKKIAGHYRLPYLDTGALYRATARDLMRKGGDLRDEAAAAAVACAIDPASLDDDGLRDRRMGEAASVVAQIPQVRAALLDYQRDFCMRPEGAVLDGRDIGTVVCPDADVKLFIQADLAARAHRRYLDLVALGLTMSEQDVFDDLQKRDERDRRREAAPLAMAADALLLDTTNLGIEASYKAAIDLVEAELGRGKQA